MRPLRRVVGHVTRPPPDSRIPRSPRHPARAALFAALLGVIAIAPLAAADDFNNRYSPNSGYQRGGVDYTADGQLVDVQVQVDGRTAPLFYAPGRFDREYFQAFRGR